MKKILLYICAALMALLLTAGLLWLLNRPAEAPAPAERAELWLEGKAVQDCPVWDGVTFFSLDDLARQGGGSFRDFFGLRLRLWGRRVKLSDGEACAWIEGQRVELPAPCRYWQGEWYAPESLLPRIGMALLEDPESGRRWYSHVPDPERIARGHEIVILRLHCVSDDVWGGEGLFMSPAKLEQQITAMEEMGCSFLSFEDLDQIDEYEKPVFLTFDDGYMDNYTELYPILQRHKAKATVFLVTGLIGREYYLNEEAIREMNASGLVSFQSHTVHHADMNAADQETREYEARESQLAVARLTNKVPFVLSFPRARANDEAMDTVARWYRYVVIADGEPWVTGSDPLRIPRFAMPRDIDMETFLGYFACFQ